MDEGLSRGVGGERGVEGKGHREIRRQPGGEKKVKHYFTAEALSTQGKAFLVNRYSDLSELRGSGVRSLLNR